MIPLYPDIKPYSEGHLAVTHSHQLYVEESGNPDGIPVLFLHGGPGMGCDHKARCFFDPEYYRIIIFDQRGAGRSTPHAELENNNTHTLLDDIETIRQHLGIERWVLFGGSWGATLALLYAEQYPQCVLGLILRGIFLARDQDIDWTFRSGASRIFPDYWQDFIEPIAANERTDLVAAYYRILIGDNELMRMAAAKAYAQWAARCATLRPNNQVVEQLVDPHNVVALAKIGIHYFVHQCFLAPDQIMQQVDRLAGIPGIIVHGRYDMVCPLDNAMTLHHAWPGSELHIVREAGHSACEPAIIDALIRATDEMARRLHVG